MAVEKRLSILSTTWSLCEAGQGEHRWLVGWLVLLLGTHVRLKIPLHAVACNVLRDGLGLQVLVQPFLTKVTAKATGLHATPETAARRRVTRCASQQTSKQENKQASTSLPRHLAETGLAAVVPHDAHFQGARHALHAVLVGSKDGSSCEWAPHVREKWLARSWGG